MVFGNKFGERTSSFLLFLLDGGGMPSISALPGIRGHNQAGWIKSPPDSIKPGRSFYPHPGVHFPAYRKFMETNVCVSSHRTEHHQMNLLILRRLPTVKYTIAMYMYRLSFQSMYEKLPSISARKSKMPWKTSHMISPMRNRYAIATPAVHQNTIGSIS